MLLADGQIDFSGGMNSRFSPERIGENQYVYARNIEIRSGHPATRRGTVRLHTIEPDNGQTFYGALVYQSPYDDEKKETILIAAGGNVYHQTAPQPPEKKLTDIGTDRAHFVQAYNYVYMFRSSQLPVYRWSGQAADDWEQVPAPTIGDQMPQSDYGIYAYNRGWVVTDIDTISASDLLSEAFDLTNNSWEINAGEGYKITALQPYVESSMLVFKEQRIWLLNNCNGDLSTLNADIIDDRHGCIAKYTIKTIGRDVWFLSRDGVRSIGLTEDNKVQLRDVTVSEPIPDLIDRINWSYARYACAEVYDNYYILSVPIDDSTTNNACIVYDLLAKTWVGLWNGGMGHERLLIGAASGQEHLYGLTSVSTVDLLLNGFYIDKRPSQKPVITGTDETFVFYDVIQPACGNTTGMLGMTFMAESGGVSSQDLQLYVYASNGSFLLLGITDTADGVWAQGWEGGVVKWVAASGAMTLADSNFHTLIVRHNGTEPEIYVDGGQIDIAFAVETDKTVWFENAVYSDTGYFALYYFDSPHSLYNFWYGSFDGKPLIKVNVDECGWSSTLSRDQLTEKITGNRTEDVHNFYWFGPEDGDPIVTQLITRGYSFGQPLDTKHVGSGELTVGHRSPAYSVTAIGGGAFEDTVALDETTYSDLTYDINGVDAWNGNAAEYNDPHRENYAPLVLSDIPEYGGTIIRDETGSVIYDEAGSALYDDVGFAPDSDGIILDKEQEHTELFFVGTVVPWAQLQIDNTKGTLSIKSLSLTATGNTRGNRGNDQ